MDDPRRLSVATEFVGDHVATSMVWMPGGRLAVASLRGRVAVFDGATGATLASGSTSLGSISTIVASPRGDVLALHGAQGRVGLWRVSTAALVGEIPVAGASAFAFTPAGLEVHAGALSTWSVPSGTPSVVRTAGGQADVTTGIDRIAIAGGDGGVSTVLLADGTVHRAELGGRVVKAVAFAPGGDALFASGMDSPRLARFDGDVATTLPGARPLRRLAALPDGSLVGPDPFRGLYWWRSVTEPPSVLAGDRGFADLERDGSVVVALDDDGLVERLEGDRFTTLLSAPGARAVALRGTRVAVAFPDAVEVHDAAGVRRLDAHGASLLDVAFSADGRTVAAVGLDPVVRVWNADTGALLGLLPGHEERVVSAEFLPGGDLVTASWDKSARLWSLAALSAPVPELADAVAAAWGRAPEPGAGD